MRNIPIDATKGTAEMLPEPYYLLYGGSRDVVDKLLMIFLRLAEEWQLIIRNISLATELIEDGDGLEGIFYAHFACDPDVIPLFKQALYAALPREQENIMVDHRYADFEAFARLMDAVRGEATTSRNRRKEYWIQMRRRKRWRRGQD